MLLSILIFSVLWTYSSNIPDYKFLKNYKPSVSSKVYSGDGELVNDFSSEKPNGSFYSNVYISKVENGAFQPSKVLKSFCSNDNSEEIVGLKNIGGKASIG